MGTIQTQQTPARTPARATAHRVGRPGRTRHDPGELGPRLDGHRRELRSHCRRMLGSGFEAEDAVQETLVRAWRSYDRFDGRSSLRSWLYRIATNVCLDMLRGPQRRARPMDLGPSAAGAEHHPGLALLGGARSDIVADARGGPVSGDPADTVASRESVRQAFVVALQSLPPRQRAVLILRDVLRWRTDEVAELLGSTETSVKSALQRARATLAGNADAALGEAGTEPDDDTQRRMLARYVDAFERTDVQSLVSLLRLDHLGRDQQDVPAA
jgi:RNA polymerase sigma-70 factor (ECF subfamily)